MSTVTVTILSQGKAIGPDAQIDSLDIRREVNRIPEAEFVLPDGDVALRRFEYSNGKAFEPGQPLEIKLRWEGNGQPDTTVFTGRAVRQTLEFDRSRGSRLRVTAKHSAIGLTGVRKRVIHRDQTDDRAIESILRAAGFTGRIDATTPQHAELVQYDATDWDFLVSRAEANGLVVVAGDSQVLVTKPALAGQARHRRIEFGIDDMYNFEMELDATRQCGELQSRGWDIKQQQPVVARGRDLALAQGNLIGDTLAKQLGFGQSHLTHPVALGRKELQAWADAALSRSRLAMIRGRISVPGNVDFGLLDVVDLAGMGQRFSGKALVTGVCHRVDGQGWRTDVQFGLSPDRFARQPEIADAPAAGLLPPVQGLQIGVVAGFQEDPDQEFRVRVNLPALDKPQETLWARLATPDAGLGRGYAFRPEMGDEVVVGFFNNDPRQPVILGSMFGSKNSLPQALAPLAEKNLKKGIVSRKGSYLRFIDEDDPAVSIGTKKNSLVLSDKDQGIRLEDQHGNSITLDKNGITITTTKDIKIDAGGDAALTGSKQVKITGSMVDVQ